MVFNNNLRPQKSVGCSSVPENLSSRREILRLALYRLGTALRRPTENSTPFKWCSQDLKLSNPEKRAQLNSRLNPAILSKLADPHLCLSIISKTFGSSTSLRRLGRPRPCPYSWPASQSVSFNYQLQLYPCLSLSLSLGSLPPRGPKLKAGRMGILPCVWSLVRLVVTCACKRLVCVCCCGGGIRR